MEGPTPSSAIFYGALSVHLGVFLLLRTQAIWGFEFASRFIVFGIGLFTVIVASLSEQAQSNIKGQIAYASITQVGFMFMELALGFETLVLLHFMGNAFLRCYQLLVSPSVVAHLLRVEAESDVGFDIRASKMAHSLPITLRDSLPQTLQNTLQVVSLQEFNLETIVRSLLWDSFRRVGAIVGNFRFITATCTILVTLGFLLYAANVHLQPYIGILCALGMLGLSILGFTRKRDPLRTWNLVGLSTLLAGCATWLTSENASSYVLLFLSGIFSAWLLGFIVIQLMGNHLDYEKNPFLYRGMDEKKPWLSLLLLLAFLGLEGFPITPAFVGQDLVLYHISSENVWMAPMIAIAFVLNGISASGVYMRIAAGRPVEVRQAQTHMTD